jgi:hypothetical protein
MNTVRLISEKMPMNVLIFSQGPPGEKANKLGLEIYTKLAQSLVESECPAQQQMMPEHVQRELRYLQKILLGRLAINHHPLSMRRPRKKRSIG